MINSNIEYCERDEDEEIRKYKDVYVFSTILNKHKVYSHYLNLYKRILNILFSLTGYKVHS